jgi:hypothetical protein
VAAKVVLNALTTLAPGALPAISCAADPAASSSGSKASTSIGVCDVDDDLAVELVLVAADDVVDGGVPDGKHHDVADQRIADLAGADVAGQLARDGLRLGGLGAEQRDRVVAGRARAW